MYCALANLTTIHLSIFNMRRRVSEHVENAGVHSGDAHLILPAQKLFVETVKRIKRVSKRIARVLRISGPFVSCFRREIHEVECTSEV
jgi:hypothetical protein